MEVRKMRLMQEERLVKKIREVKKEVAKFHHLRDMEAREEQAKAQRKYEEWEDIAEEVLGVGKDSG